MKRTLLFILILLFQFNCIMFSQSKKVESLKKKGRDSLIEQALHLTGLNIDMKSCMISVKANKTSVIVSFHQPVLFLPVNTVYNYGYACDLAEGISWSGVISNPVGYGADRAEIPDYSLTDDMKEHIKFVFEAINKSDETGNISFEDLSFEDQMIIRDQKTYYDVTILSSYQESFYKIDKKTGMIFDAGHAHLIPEPSSEDDPYEEIK